MSNTSNMPNRQEALSAIEKEVYVFLYALKEAQEEADSMVEAGETHFYRSKANAALKRKAADLKEALLSIRSLPNNLTS